MKTTKKKILHALLMLTLVGALSLALNAGRSLFAEEEPASVPASSTSPAAAEYVGAESCSACHADEVESFKTSVHGRGLAKQKDIALEKSCETCHGPGSLHVNSGGDKADPGFATVKISEKNMVASCSKCHIQSHWQGSAHERAEVGCSSCHSVHSAKSKKNLFKTARPEDTCYTCHANVKSEMKRSSHMPVEEGKMGCSSCHDSHGTAHGKNLKASNIPQLCYQCHQEKRGPFLWDHAPVRENCSSCHQPHGSQHDKMLTAKQPFLCQKCHDYNRHPSTIYDGVDVTNQSAYIFGQSCMACHPNIHGSNHPAGKMFTR